MGEISVEFKRTERDIEKCETYYDTAKFIVSTFGLDHTEEVIHRIAMMVKKYGHNAKLSVYSRYKDYFTNFTENNSMGEHITMRLKEVTDTKIETHKHYREMEAK